MTTTWGHTLIGLLAARPATGYTVVAGAGPRDTTRYAVTAAGRRTLSALLLATTPDVIEALRQRHRRTLAEFLTHRTDDDPATQEWGPEATSRATLERASASRRVGSGGARASSPT